MAVSLLSLLSSLLLATSTVAAHPVSNRPRDIQIPDGFVQVLFQDNFAALAPGSLPDASKWTIDVGTGYPGGPARWGTNEIQTYTSSRDNIAATAAGTLKITPLALGNGRWTSARIETTPAHDFACAPGRRLRMQARLRAGSAPATSQQGIWPAFWSLGAAFRGNYGGWPGVGEIDVLETLNGAATAWQTVHCGVAAGGPCRETDGISATAAVSRGDWHTVAVDVDRTNAGGDWRGETITWLVDGRPTSSVSGAVVGDLAAWTSLARTPRFLLLNVAVGGSFPDAVAKIKTPNAATRGGDGSELEISDVAVFST